jgi:hypothetical protein
MGRSSIGHQRQGESPFCWRLYERLGMRPRVDDRQVEAAIYRMASELRQLSES